MEFAGPDTNADNTRTPSDILERPKTILTRLDEIAAEPLHWVWPGWIPSGMLTILGGHVGDGKSTVVAALIAALTSGHPLPDGTTVDPVNILVLSTEDDPARVIRPRLDANHVDPARVFIMELPATIATRRTWPDNQDEAGMLRAVIDDHRIGLIVVDPLSGILRRADRASEGEVREALQPLMDVIAGTGVAVLGVMRVGLSTIRRKPAQALVGSSIMPSLARSVLMIARDRTADTPGARVLEVVKSNYADPPKPVALTMDANGAVTWLGPASATIDELAESEHDPRLSRTEREDAVAFLKALLENGPVRATTVLERARKSGYSEITIRRAKKDAGIRSLRPIGFRGAWRWCLPGQEDPPSKPLKLFETTKEEYDAYFEGYTKAEREEAMLQLIATTLENEAGLVRLPGQKYPTLATPPPGNDE